MNSQYFRLTWDVYVPGLWYLDDPLDSDGAIVEPWVFSDGERVAVKEPLRIPQYVPGCALDFSEFSTFPIPVVSQRLAQLLTEKVPDDIQLISPLLKLAAISFSGEAPIACWNAELGGPAALLDG